MFPVTEGPVTKCLLYWILFSFRFSKQMKASIPRLRESIKDASMRELNDFLENIRKFSPKIGELAMRHTAEKLNVDPTFYGQQTKKQQVRSQAKKVVSIDFFWAFFVTFSYNGVYLRREIISYPLPPPKTHFKRPNYSNYSYMTSQIESLRSN